MLRFARNVVFFFGLTEFRCEEELARLRDSFKCRHFAVESVSGCARNVSAVSRFFPTKHCGVLVFRSALPGVSSYLLLLLRRLLLLSRRHFLSHNFVTYNFLTNNFVTRHLLSHNFVTYNFVTYNFVTQLCHTHHLSHKTLSHIFLTPSLSHTFSHTIVTHTAMSHTIFTHNFVTHHLSHTIFHTHLYTQFCHTPSFTDLSTVVSRGKHATWPHPLSFCVADVSTFVFRCRRGTYDTLLGLVTR